MSRTDRQKTNKSLTSEAKRADAERAHSRAQTHKDQAQRNKLLRWIAALGLAVALLGVGLILHFRDRPEIRRIQNLVDQTNQMLPQVINETTTIESLRLAPEALVVNLKLSPGVFVDPNNTSGLRDIALKQACQTSLKEVLDTGMAMHYDYRYQASDGSGEKQLRIAVLAADCKP